MINNKPSCSQERLKMLISYFNLNQTQLSKRTGVGRSAIANYLSGLREPKQDALFLLSSPFGVDPVWLMGYDVPMFKPKVNTSEISDTIFEHYDVKQVADAYSKADEVTKEMVKRILGI